MRLMELVSLGLVALLSLAGSACSHDSTPPNLGSPGAGRVAPS